ncbi:MAG: hypothetical protein J5684_02740, partial [Eubacterium sp.]|nr:hypothetical protein [Eubacterium sp.]
MKNEINTFRHHVSFKVLLTILTAFLCISFVTGDVSADTSKFRVEVSATKNVDGKTYNVVMDVTNMGSDFKGIIRVIAKSYNYKTAFDVDIAVPAGSTKQYSVKVPTLDQNTYDNLRVSIFDKKDKEVFSNQYNSVFSAYSGKIRQGILSDTPDDLRILDLGGDRFDLDGETYVIEQTAVDGATLKDSINELDMLVIDNYDTSVLSEETIDGIERWNANGGMLIIGTGKNAERVISGFDNGSKLLLQFQNCGSIKRRLHPSGQEYDMDEAMFSYDISYNYCTNDYIRAYCTGSGSVSVLSIDLKDFALENTFRNDAISEMYKDAYGNTPGKDKYRSTITTSTDLGEAQSYMQKPAKTGGLFITAIILFYIVLVGPGIYLILKALKKRECIWIAIPVISLAFVGMIFLYGLGIRVRGHVINSVKVIDLLNKTKDTYVFGYSPKAENWEIYSKGEYDYAISLPDNYYLGDEKPAGSVNAKNDGVLLKSFPNKTFQPKAFDMVSSVGDQGTIEYEVHSSSEKTVTN